MAESEEFPDKMSTLVNAVEKLARNVESIDRSVTSLTDRIVPYEGEEDRPLRFERWRAGSMKSVADIMGVIKLMDTNIQGIERDVAFVKSRIEGIDNSVVSREDFKQWIRHKPK